MYCSHSVWAAKRRARGMSNKANGGSLKIWQCHFSDDNVDSDQTSDTGVHVFLTVLDALGMPCPSGPSLGKQHFVASSPQSFVAPFDFL